MRRVAIRSLFACVALLAVTAIADVLSPPPLDRVAARSAMIVDKDGRLVHAFTTPDGKWRFAADLDRIDPTFIARLIAVEDKRFHRHAGVDLLAAARAAGSFVRTQSISSGASTITMQLARLIEPRPRNVGSKLVEMLRAAQIERRLSKREILELYLTLAPYGGNLEGVRAASLMYFDKEPAALSDAEQALLIALPQAPEARRPDRKLAAAKAARARILKRLATLGAMTETVAREAEEAPIAPRRATLDAAAWHAARELSRRAADYPYAIVPSTLDVTLQQTIERILASAMENAADGATAAAIVVETKTNAVRAAVGAADRAAPGGWIDLTNSIRSPGSTLKPFIYALAFDDGVLAPNSVIDDIAQSFDGYAPENFDKTFRGEVRASEALQHSLNVPAVRILDRLGAKRVAALLAAAGARLSTPSRAEASTGLTLALGGAGASVRDLAILYAALAEGGGARPLAWTQDDLTAQTQAHSFQLFSPESAMRVSAILEDGPSLEGRAPLNLIEDAPSIAMKTGTSYGYRDAWSAGHAGGFAVVVWVGRADGAPRPGVTGRDAAAPLLFSIYDALWRLYPGAGRAAPRSADEEGQRAQRRLETASRLSPPEIVFPRDGVELYTDQFGEGGRGFALSARGGAGAYRWYVAGEPVAPEGEGRRAVWRPNGPGYYEITVVDRDGRSSRTMVKVTSEV